MILYLLQFRSSDESLQSAIRLQRHDNGIQRPPVSHLHSLIPQASNSKKKKRNKILFLFIYSLILPVVEYKSKKLEQKKKISIFKFIDELSKIIMAISNLFHILTMLKVYIYYYCYFTVA
jgi:L-cystine uptake protein TcyP (sodium:dicarboxylate symporter family)